MPTIVELTSTGDRYLLLGAAYGMAHSARPNRLLGDLFPTEKHGQLHLLALCDAAGTVEWAHPSACRVVSVDGQTPEAILGGAGHRAPETGHRQT